MLIYTYLSKIIIGLILISQPVAFLQLSSKWQPPKQIPNYQLTARAPLLVADDEENIHVFNYENISPSLNAIFYRKWNLKEGWSPPVDIILTGLGGGPQTLQAAKLDNQGFIHLLYYVGTEINGDFYLTSAPLDEVNVATGWSSPQIIAAKAGPLPFASMLINDNGEFFVFFMSKQDGNGLYMVHSTDYGNSWSQPLALSLINQNNRWPASIQSTFSQDGKIHVVWSVVSDAGVGEEIRYGRLNDAKNAFEQEELIAKREGSDYSANWPVIFDHEDQLMIVYQDSFPATRWMRISNDNGQSWTQPIRPFPHIGEYEYTAITKDSLGGLHMVLGNRTSDPEIHGMWYSKWSGNRWSTLEPITSGPVTDSYDPSAPQAIILQGNILFATWWNNVRRDNLSGAWYSYRLLDAPALSSPEITPLPDPTTSLNPTPTTTEGFVSATPTEKPGQKQDFSKSQSAFQPAMPVFLGIIPVVALIAFAFFIQRRNRHP